MTFRTLGTELIYRGRIFSVRRDRVELPNGSQTHLEVVEHRGAVAIVPIDEDGQIWFIRQHRHAAGDMLLEIPAGMLEDSEDPLACAQREVREETGMAAADIRKIGEFYMAPGYSTELLHIYLAKGLSSSPLEQDDDEFLSVEKIPWQKAYEIARSGQIRDGKTLAALLLAEMHIQPAGG